MYLVRRKLFLPIIIAIALAGCGGGGDSSPSAGPAPAPVQIISYPLFAAYKNRVNTGSNENFSISGTCTGSANVITAPTSAANFEGVAGFGSSQTIRLTYTNCSPASAAITGTSYYDSNYGPLGSVIPNTEYARYQALPQPIPLSIKAGDTAILATQDVYTDSSKTTRTGQRTVSFVAEAETVNSIFFTRIVRAVNTANQLLFTEQTKYRLTDSGALSILSIDIQYSTTSNNRLVLTKI
jgi:hypothetical protein